ncbi:mitochondrial ribosomal subunit protein-domain-containing protein [Poronia punctata]|nr:mitochondrial ribosomal subunit protein-domain-containing protein [Poronia punctata]
MASAVQSLRQSLCAASRRTVRPASVAPRQFRTLRPFSASSSQRLPRNKKGLEQQLDDAESDDRIFEELEEAARAIEESNFKRAHYKEALGGYEANLDKMYEKVLEANKPAKVNVRNSFWFETEPDTSVFIREKEENSWGNPEEDITPLGHAKLEEFREYREYARIAAWQMPLLSKLAIPFEPPTAQQPLRFRYTSYMGEFHPAEKKVVVEFSPKDLPLNEAQQQKLRKLLGPRWNPETDIAKMSCEQFDHPAQNKRYLGDLVNKLVAEAKDSTDMFEDVPLDTRHHTFQTKPKFPKEWRMTEERRKEIEDTRQKLLLLDEVKQQEGKLVDGREKIEMFFNSPKPIPEYATVRLSKPAATPARRR